MLSSAGFTKFSSVIELIGSFVLAGTVTVIAFVSVIPSVGILCIVSFSTNSKASAGIVIVKLSVNAAAPAAVFSVGVIFTLNVLCSAVASISAVTFVFSPVSGDTDIFLAASRLS